MRLSLTIAALLWLGGCAQNAQAPLDADLARLELKAMGAGDRLSAYRLNGKTQQSLRFPDLPAGQHSLQVRYQFNGPGAAGRGSLSSEPQLRTCILALDYAHFTPGTTYQLQVRQLGWRTIGWLSSAQGERLADARVIRCGPGV